jgi:UDP-glucose 4-epimerase
MKTKSRKVLVTGGAGFIGSHLVDRLISEGFAVRVLDSLETGSLDRIASNLGKEGFDFVKGDIRDYDTVRRASEDVDFVFHEAAIASIAVSLENPLLVNEVNVTGTLNLLKASLDNGVRKFIYASSAAVYGNAPPAEKTEDMVLNPNSPYGISKLAAEYYVKAFYELYGLGTVSLRYFNVYGPRQRFDPQSAYAGVVTIFVNKLVENLPPVVFGDGEQTRDFVYVEDVVEGNMLALECKSASGEVFNIGTGIGVSVNKIAETLKTIMNKRHLKNAHEAPRPADARHGHSNISKARRILKYSPRFSVEDGLPRLVNWYVKNANRM